MEDSHGQAHVCVLRVGVRLRPLYGCYVPNQLQQFRPLSIMREMSDHSPVKEDDIMITVSPSAGAMLLMMMLMVSVRRCLVADTFVGAP